MKFVSKICLGFLSIISSVALSAGSGSGGGGGYASGGKEAGKTLALTIPVYSRQNDASLRAEYNLNTHGSLALEYSTWGSGEGIEELTKKELSNYPNSSLTTKGKNIGFMVGRYAHPASMSGFNWGLGLGYREGQAQWRKDPVAREAYTQGINVDQDGMVLYNLKYSGPTVASRIGYRYVGEDIGFMAGISLALKHFENKVKDQVAKDGEEASTAIPKTEKVALQNRMATIFNILVEVGYAF